LPLVKNYPPGVFNAPSSSCFPILGIARDFFGESPFSFPFADFLSHAFPLAPPTCTSLLTLMRDPHALSVAQASLACPQRGAPIFARAYSEPANELPTSPRSLSCRPSQAIPPRKFTTGKPTAIRRQWNHQTPAKSLFLANRRYTSLCCAPPAPLPSSSEKDSHRTRPWNSLPGSLRSNNPYLAFARAIELFY